MKTIVEAKTKFQEEDVKILLSKEQDLAIKISNAEQIQKDLKEEITLNQNLYCMALKQENE